MRMYVLVWGTVSEIFDTKILCRANFWIFGGAKVLISTHRVGINKGVINPLSEAEK